MEDFKLRRTPDGDVLTVSRPGPELLRFPLYNKGTGFTLEERAKLGIEALLPAEDNDIGQQAERIYRSIFFNPDPVGRNIGLAALQDRNEVLFYRVLSQHLEETMPIVYTPTVGKASEYYSRVFRTARGIFITPAYKGRIEDVLRQGAPYAGVELMVVTDNEAILGIGDQGAGGMAISIGKLALYCVGAGIHPAKTLPVSLDVGTDNEELLNDPFYLGWRKRRLRGREYRELVDEFVTAAQCVFPDVVIQWEDFRKDNALMILDRYRDRVPSFNDDIEGTGAIALACVQGACRISGTDFTASRVVLYGAGAAGLGIARQLRQRLAAEGVHGAALRRAIVAMDSRGVITDDRDGLDEYKRELAVPAAAIAGAGLAGADLQSLAKVVAATGANVLIGASGQRRAFDRDAISALLDNAEQPVVLPMSNPTSISEAVPEDVLEWSGGRALIATGSPFEPVATDTGIRRIGQANNVFVFPGIGLGTLVAGAGRVTDGMISAAATALAGALSEQDIVDRSLMPEVSRLWDVCGAVAAAVARQAMDEGLAEKISDDELDARIEAMRWRPEYPRIVVTSPGAADT